MHSYSPRRSHYRVRTGGGCRRISRSTSRQASRQDCVSLIYLVPDRIVLDDRLFAFVFYRGCRVYVRWWLTGTDYSWATLEVVVPPFIPRYPTRLPSYLPASRPELSSSPAPAGSGEIAAAVTYPAVPLPSGGHNGLSGLNGRRATVIQTVWIAGVLHPDTVAIATSAIAAICRILQQRLEFDIQKRSDRETDAVPIWCSSRMISAARSPMITHGAMVLPVVTRGMIDPSAMRRLSMP